MHRLVRSFTLFGLLLSACTSFGQEAKKLSVLDLPRLQAIVQVNNARVAAAMTKGDYAAAEAILRTMTKSLSDPNMHYNLACALAQQGKTDEALEVLAKSVEYGFRNRAHMQADKDLTSLREHARFKEILLLAKQPLKAEKKAVRVNPAVASKGQVVVTPASLVWTPQVGMFRVFVRVPKPDKPLPVAKGKGSVGELLRKWFEEGTAAGNYGDFYDNHDSDHSNMNYASLPQLTRIEFSDEIKKRGLHHGLQRSFLYSGVTIGNSSTALTSGPFWRSQPRLALTTPGGPARLFLQYRSSHLYFYPEHRDYDPAHSGGRGDVYPANTPYVVISKGSSGSDRPFMDAVGATLAAFRPEVKAKLAKNGMLMSTVQMIFRRSNANVLTDDDYFRAKAHPAVFSGSNIRTTRMINRAHGMTLESLPPFAQIQVTEEELGVVGVDYFAARPSEVLFNTPSAVARIARSSRFERRMVIDASKSIDLNGKPLTYRWALLQGDVNRVRIKKLNDDGSKVEVRIGYHPRSSISKGGGMGSSRVDIGLFVSNGDYDSAPAFVSLLYLDNERRVYDDQHRIKVVDYRSPAVRKNYVDPMLDVRKDWTDEYNYDKEGKLLGWTRTRDAGEKQQFAPDGKMLVKDGTGKVVGVEVRYAIVADKKTKVRSLEQRLVETEGN